MSATGRTLLRLQSSQVASCRASATMPAVRLGTPLASGSCFSQAPRQHTRCALSLSRLGSHRGSLLLSGLQSSLRPGFSRGFAAVHAVAAAPATVAPKVVNPPKEAHGFELTRQQYVKEYDSHMLLYKHKKTGAEVLSVLNSDENKTFGVVLRTPVDNSCGIPHILEHSVLCGSRKYPIKEPFVELMKGSLNTFLNAFTYPDRTCYPVASTNTQDFYNLVDVYLDAVFHPKCITDKMTFQQEGWHYEIEDPKEDLEFKGVVFNEMKGVYSSPDSIFYREVQHHLFPDNTYRHDSGGAPSRIPDLTFEQFQDFHARYYHPSNARFWFYGDDNPEKRLEILDSFLAEYDARAVDSRVIAQPLKTEPRKVTEYYAAGDNEDGNQKAFTAVNWVLTEKTLDVETELALGFLDYLLLGTSASPLRKALNDSGLGSAIVGGGIDDELKQPIFCLGLKGVEPENVDKVEALILTKLEELAASGFTSSAIEAAINSIEFSLRENNTGSFPRGLSLMLRAMGAWIYDEDPLRPIQWEESLNHFKAKLADGEEPFGKLIRQYLLENPHRVTLTLLPDKELDKKTEEQEKARLRAAKESFSDQELEAVIASTKALKERQETPDSPEALACVPSLKLSDIPRSVTPVPTTVTQSAGSTLLTHDLFTNDVLYLEAGLSLRPVPQELLPLVPLFCRSLTNMGTEKESFVELTERIGRKTGGLSISPFMSPVRGQEDPAAFIFARGKAMQDKSGDLLSLFRDVLLTAKLDDRERFKQMVLETKASLEAGVVGSGHRFAGQRLAGQRSKAGYVSELMGGLSYLQYIRSLAKRVESDWEGVQADLESIRKLLLQRSGSIVNITADERTISTAMPHIQEFLSSLPESSAAPASWSGTLPYVNEALTVPTQVNYVGKAANLFQDAGYKLSGAAYVIDKYLGTTHLWNEVRVIGGAYGGFCTFDPQSGLFSYLSYRDPNLLDTVKAYDRTVDFLRALDIDQEELTRAIIGTIGDVDAYQLPDAKGYSQLTRYILGVTDEERQQRRDEILGTTLKDFKEFGEVLDVVRGDKARVVAVTSESKAKAVNEEIPGFWEITNVL